MTRITYEMRGLDETLKAVNGLEKDLRKEANAELRVAGKEAAGKLAEELVRAAGASGVPVAPLVASSVRVKSDRKPTVSIGGSKRVGRRGGSAGALLWGSEHGPSGAVNHFAVPANGAGYWIAPTSKRFASSEAVAIYRRAVDATVSRYRLD